MYIVQGSQHSRSAQNMNENKYKNRLLEYSQETQKQILDFAKAVYSAAEIYNFPFQIRLLLNKGYKIDDILELTKILNSKILDDKISLGEDERFNIELTATFLDRQVPMNFYKYNNTYWISSKTYLNDVHEIPKEKISDSQVDKIFFVGNEKLLSNLRNFIAQIETTEKTNSMSNNKTILDIDKKNKTISKDSGEKKLVCPFRSKATGKNKRFEYVVKLTQNEKKWGGSKLSDTSSQNISTEITKINQRLIDDLDLIHDVIKNDNNSGYEIDKNFYEPVFV